MLDQNYGLSLTASATTSSPAAREWGCFIEVFHSSRSAVFRSKQGYHVKATGSRHTQQSEEVSGYVVRVNLPCLLSLRQHHPWLPKYRLNWCCQSFSAHPQFLYTCPYWRYFWACGVIRVGVKRAKIIHFKPKSGVIFEPIFRNHCAFLNKFKVEITEILASYLKLYEADFRRKFTHFPTLRWHFDEKFCHNFLFWSLNCSFCRF